MVRVKAFATRHTISALLLALTLIYASGISSIRSLFAEGFVSTQFLPQVLVAIALVAILAIAWRDERAAKQASEDDNPVSQSPGALGKPFLLFVAILGYIAVFRPLGFFFSTIALSLCCLWLFNYASEARTILHRIGRCLLIATFITGLAYMLFAVAFGARLPLFPGSG